jgi:hypothetical protein
MDGSAIDSFLPIFSILITTFRAIIQCGGLQTLVPAVPEECASPMCTLLFSCMLFQISFVCFFFKPPLLLFVFFLLVAFLFLLTLPLVKENACSYPGLGSGRFPNFNLVFQDTRSLFVDLFHCHLSCRINYPSCFALAEVKTFTFPFSPAVTILTEKTNHVLRERVAIQLHLVVKFQVTLLGSLLDPHPENLAIINGVRIPVMKITVTFLFNSIGPKHRMPLWQLDSAFLYQELKKAYQP